MGLHNTAHYLKSKGRGTDTELVHMSKREIKGLQQLAKAKGGSLTINPDTGLVEAGFLEDALPIVAAAAATYFTAGAAAPALTTAFGGSALAGGLAAGALAGAGISGLTAAITGKDVGNAALMGGLGGAAAGGLGAYGPVDANALANATQEVAVKGGTQVATEAATGAATQTAAGAVPEAAAGYGTATSAPMTQQQFADVSAFTGTPQAPGSVPAGVPSPTFTNTPTGAELRTLQAGGPQAPIAEQSYYAGLKPDQYIQKAGILALPAAGLLMDQPQQQLGPEPESGSYLKRISPNFTAYQPPQPNPYYRAQYPTYAAEGGIMQSYAGGGPVEQMSQNMMGGQGNMYPLSQQDTTQFATPTQMPASAEIIRSDYDTKTNPYSGVMMASGGEVKGYATGGLPDLGPSFSWGNTQAYTGTQAQEQAAMAANQAAGINTIGSAATTTADMMGANRNVNQPTGQSIYPSATAMQGGFGQGAQGYPSFSSSSGGGAGGSGGPFPLEGQYGIIKMAKGGLPEDAPRLSDVKTFADADANTRGLSALDAAQYRNKKLMAKSGIKMAEMPKTGIKSLGGDFSDMAAAGGTAHLGDYSDGGRLLKGPGDGMSDNIPATIGRKQPARLADGEFVVPADVVSHLGNGSTDAGAKRLYAMMDKVRRARTGKKKQAPSINMNKYLPA